MFWGSFAKKYKGISYLWLWMLWSGIYDVWLIYYKEEKPMGADLSDKTAGSIISVLPVSVFRTINAVSGARFPKKK